MNHLKSVLLILVLSGVLSVKAQTTYYTAANGNWALTNTWIGGEVPPTADSTKFVRVNHTLNLATNTTYRYDTLFILNGGSLTRTGNGGPTNIYGTIVVRGGSLSTTGMGAGLNVYGDIILDSGSINITQTSNGVIGAVTLNGGTFTGDAPVTGSVTVSGGTFNSTGDITGNVAVTGGVLTGSANITGGLTVSGGTFSGSGDVTGNVTVTSGTYSGTGTVDGDVYVSGGTYTGGGTVNGDVFIGKYIEKDSTLTSNVTVGGNFTISLAGNVKTNGYQMLGVDSAFIYGTLVVTNTGGLQNDVNGFFNDSTVIVLGSQAIIEYAATTGVQTITPKNYRKLNLKNNSEKVLGGNVSVDSLLTIESGKLNLGSQTLTISGRLNTTSQGVLKANGNSNLVINGSGELDTLYFDQSTPGTTNRFNNMTLNRAAANAVIGNGLQIKGIITPTAGTIVTNNNLTLVSNSEGTASIATGTGSYISGDVTVERYVPAVARRWRFMASPVANATLADWKNEMYITGSGGTNNGFDFMSTNAHTVFTYNESVVGGVNDGWANATSITNPLTAGQGFRVFVRGDRSDSNRITNSALPQNEVTLNVVGPVNTGNITMPVSFTSSGTLSNDGWCLLGNPYPCAFDWNAFYDNGTNLTNIDPTIYVYDPVSNNYKSYNALSNAGNLTDGIIASGQAFWVKANASNPSMTFTEAFKVTSSHSSLFKTTEGEAFTLKVTGDALNFDEVLIKYLNGSTTNRDNYDITKMSGSVNVSAYGNDGQQLALSVRPLTSANDTIRLRVTVPSTGNYTMTFTNSNKIAIQDQVFLVDAYTQQVINLKTTPSYTFNVTTSVAASQGSNRFYIVVASNNSLPVELVHFGAVAGKNQTANLSWTTAAEVNASFFEIEHSTDGSHFEAVGNVAASGQTSELVSYAYEHATRFNTNYYRLKMVDQDGTFSYSEIRAVNFDAVKATENTVRLFPVPAVTELHIQLENKQSISRVQVYNSLGTLVMTAAQNGNTIQLNGLESGVYFLEITTENGTVYQESFLKK